MKYWMFGVLVGFIGYNTFALALTSDFDPNQYVLFRPRFKDQAKCVEEAKKASANLSKLSSLEATGTCLKLEIADRFLMVLRWKNPKNVPLKIDALEDGIDWETKENQISTLVATAEGRIEEVSIVNTEKNLKILESM